MRYTEPRVPRWAVARRQLSAIAIFLALFSLLLAVLYRQDRHREWNLRQEQADHRLQLGYELITRDLDRVRSDVLYVASQQVLHDFQRESKESREAVEQVFSSFLSLKRTYQQIRLVDLTGMETVRADISDDQVIIIPQERLQDKSDRYYVRNSMELQSGEVFVSEFDLNQEQGEIERPLVPVVRFVTPVSGPDDAIQYLLVVNYQGGPLLNELANVSLPGNTYLVRDNGDFLLGPRPEDAWAWLLNHSRNFQNMFPNAWTSRSAATATCILTSEGAFAFQPVPLRHFGVLRSDLVSSGHKLLLVSHLPAEDVFATSNQLFGRLVLLALAAWLALVVITRFWAVASVRRNMQNRLIKESASKLRELSTRLLRIQEEERRAISREIHDQLGQQATAINLDLKLALRQTESKAAREQLSRAIEETEQLIDTLQNFATRVRPTELDDLGLHDAVESHLWEFSERTQIAMEYQSNIDGVSLPSQVAENAYRLIQESLNNVVKHAKATRVVVSIQLESQNGHQLLTLQVKDNGTGTTRVVDGTADGPRSLNGSSRLGILGMRERVDLLGGSLQFDSQTDRGTTITAIIPV